MDTQLFSAVQAATLCGKSLRTLRSWRNSQPKQNPLASFGD